MTILAIVVALGALLVSVILLLRKPAAADPQAAVLRNDVQLLRDATARLYGLTREQVYVMPPEGLAGYTGPDLVVLLHPATSPGFGLEFDAGDEFEKVAGGDEAAVARRLCGELGVRGRHTRERRLRGRGCSPCSPQPRSGR